jgi:Protein of unknown function (DUF998)
MHLQFMAVPLDQCPEGRIVTRPRNRDLVATRVGIRGLPGSEVQGSSAERTGSAPSSGASRLDAWAGTRPSPAAAVTLALSATGGLVLTVILAAVGHVDADPAYNPLTLTVSDYAVSDRGGLVDAAMVTLGVASLALLAGLRVVWAPVRATAAALFLVWVGGLLASAVVPTDPIGAPMSPAGLVHRYTSVSACRSRRPCSATDSTAIGGGRPPVRGCACSRQPAPPDCSSCFTLRFLATG